MIWPLADAPEVMKLFLEVIADAPDDVYGFFATMTVPPGPPFPEPLHLTKACAIVWCFTGEAAQAEKFLERVRRSRAARGRLRRGRPVPALTAMFDALYPSGLQWYWKGDFFEKVDPAAIALHLKYSERLPTMHSAMHLYPIDGAAARVGESDTAWAHRRARFSQVIVGVDPDPVNGGRIREWAETTGWRSSSLLRQRVREFHDGRRGRRAGARVLRRQLREAHAGEGAVRSDELLPREPEHRRASLTRAARAGEISRRRWPHLAQPAGSRCARTSRGPLRARSSALRDGRARSRSRWRGRDPSPGRGPSW